jgi:6-phosphogluconolactonase/glucosamine-6-phosphate isomerase/deaminase
MHYINTTSPDPVIQHLSQAITDALAQGQSVLWLISGGSTIAIAVAVARQLQNNPQLEHLNIMQIDERYGDPGHAHSNWQALLDAGFDCGAAHCTPILRGLPLTETVEAYKEELAQALQKHDYTIGLFGIGADGHTAGMLPDSSAARETQQLAASFIGTDFPRITMTTPAIAQLDIAIAYAVGDSKAPAMHALHTDLSIPEQPAQALKRAASVYVYTDTKEEA